MWGATEGGGGGVRQQGLGLELGKGHGGEIQHLGTWLGVEGG